MSNQMASSFSKALGFTRYFKSIRDLGLRHAHVAWQVGPIKAVHQRHARKRRSNQKCRGGMIVEARHRFF